MSQLEQPLETTPTAPVSARRLRITHFFLLTALCAFVATLRIAWVDWQSIPAENEKYYRTYSIFMAFVYGAAITSIILFVRQRWKTGQAQITQPGHWLLLFLATTALLEGLVSLAVLAYIFDFTSSPQAEYYAWNLEKILLCSAVAINCFVFARRLQGNWCWKTLLYFPGCVLLALVPQHFFAMNNIWRNWFDSSHGYAQILVCVINILLVILGSFFDRRNRSQQDWLHWFGIVLIIVLAIAGVINGIRWISYY